MRKSHKQIRDFYLTNFNFANYSSAIPQDSKDNALWREFFGNSDWLSLVFAHLSYARKTTEYFKGDTPTSVMCEYNVITDTQYVLAALVQLMEDPYFRTLKGYS